MANRLHRRKEGDEQILTQEGTLEDQRLTDSGQWELIGEGDKLNTLEPALLSETGEPREAAPDNG